MKKAIMAIGGMNLLLLGTISCSLTSPSSENTQQIFETRCVPVENSSLDLRKINGNIVSTDTLFFIYIIGSSGEQVYALKDLAIDAWPTSFQNLRPERSWLTGYWFTSSGEVIYEIRSALSDSGRVRVIGGVNPRTRIYRTIYMATTPPYLDVVGLLGDEYLLIKDHSRIDKLNLILLNIITGDMQTIYPSFLDIYSGVFWGLDGISRTLNPLPWYEHQFSPNKKFVFLFVSDFNGMKYILWDNKRERIIWEKDAHSPSSADPQWSSASDKIAYIERRTMTILYKDGREYDLSLPGDKDLVTNAQFLWSPGDRYLGFWVRDSSQEITHETIHSYSFVVYDTKDKKIVDTCIQGWGEFFWSPDGSEVLILETVTEKDHQYVWLDVKQNYALRFNFAHGVIIGWVK